MWDFLRFVLITMVCILHLPVGAWQPLKNTWFIGETDTIVMPAFSLITGIFSGVGGRGGQGSYARVVCYTLGTSCLQGYFLQVFGFLRDGAAIELWPRPFEVWYLFCVFAWRSTIAPIFELLSVRWALPRMVPFALCTALCYFGLHWPAINQLDDKTMIKTFYYGQLHALGVAVPRSTWEWLLTRKAMQASGLAFTVAWHVLASMYPHMYQWNPCKRGLRGGDNKWPGWMLHDPLSLYGFGQGIAWFAIDFELAVSALAVFACVCHMVEHLTPRVCELAVNCGSRTLFVYVLQYWVIELCLMFNARQLFHVVFGDWLRLGTIVMAMWWSTVLGSQLTERLFKWYVYPFWLMDVPRLLWDSLWA